MFQSYFDINHINHIQRLSIDHPYTSHINYQRVSLLVETLWLHPRFSPGTHKTPTCVLSSGTTAAFALEMSQNEEV